MHDEGDETVGGTGELRRQQELLEVARRLLNFYGEPVVEELTCDEQRGQGSKELEKESQARCT